MNSTPTPQPQPRPLIIGLYGIPGSGKTHLVNQLRDELASHYLFFDGSAMITRLVPDGLPAFKTMSFPDQTRIREEAISKIAAECQNAGKVGVVAGHHIFWDDEASATPTSAGTLRDWETHTHVVYLKTDPGVVEGQRKRDVGRERGDLGLAHLRKWQEKEVEELREICGEWGILLAVLTGGDVSVEAMKELLEELRGRGERMCWKVVGGVVGSAVASSNTHTLKMMLVFDADRTLAPVDTGALFWSDELAVARFPVDPQKAVFIRQGYTYAAFRQAMLLHEEFSDDDFDAICERVAAKVQIFPEMEKLLDDLAKTPHVGAIVVTCGLRRIWEKVLERHGCSHVTLIAGGHLTDGYVVTDVVKKHVVDELHRRKIRVVAFGDSPLDIPMLQAADEAYIVVCDDKVRSKSMDAALTKAIEEDRLPAVQIVLAEGCSHRLDLNKMPKVTLDDVERRRLVRVTHAQGRFLHATNQSSAKLLMTATRDAANRGPALREAHERVGEYLATQYFGEILGLEEIEIQHVQGKAASGHRIRDKRATLIIPAMRGGEPMAFGVNKVLPQASFVHAKKFADIDQGHFKGRRTIVLVDSVINTGKSMVEDFIKPIRAVCPHVRIVVVAGVVQADALKEDGTITQLLRDDVNLYVVALRQSQNSYKGQGTTDTGDRLFNTTYM